MFTRNNRIRKPYFAFPTWILIILFSGILWILWPFILDRLLIAIKLHKLFVDNSDEHFARLGQLGDLFGGISALASFITLLILVLSRSEQVSVEKNAFLIAKTPILLELDGLLKTENCIDAFYAVEYKVVKYNGNFHNTPREKKLDELLFSLDLICLQSIRGVLDKQDMSYFDYKIFKTMSNDEVKKYIDAISFLKAHDKINHLENLKKYYHKKFKMGKREIKFRGRVIFSF